MFFTPIFSFLEKFEPYTKAVSSALGMITNYRLSQLAIFFEGRLDNELKI